MILLFRPKRTEKDYASVVKPDYSVLLTSKFWMNYLSSVDVRE